MRPRPRSPGRRAARVGWRDASLLGLDFETTGLDLGRDRVVSFGAVPVQRGAVVLGDAVHRLVDPGDRTPSRASVTVHGIRPVELAGQMPAEAAASELARLLDRRFLLAWFADVETAFLRRMFGRRSRWDGRTVDVRDLYRAEAGEGADRASLSTAAAACGVPVADPHHALDDALVTAQLFLVLAARRERRAGRTPAVGDLVRRAMAAEGRTSDRAGTPILGT